MQAFEHMAVDSDQDKSISVTAQELQSGKRADVQLLKPCVPHIQLGNVSQLSCISNHYCVEPV